MAAIDTKLAAELGVADWQVKAAIDLLDGGRDGAVHRALSQGGHRHPRRHPAAHPGGAPRVSAGPRGAPGGGAGGDRGAGQARARTEGAHPGGRHQGPAGGPLPPLQGQAPDEGAGGPRSRTRAAGRGPARPAGPAAGGGGRSLRRCRQGRRRRRRRPGGRPRDPHRALQRGPGTGGIPARDRLAARPHGRHGEGRQGRLRREVLGLLRLLGSPGEAALAPHPGAVPGREGGGAGSLHRRRGGGRAGQGPARIAGTAHRQNLRHLRPGSAGRRLPPGDGAPRLAHAP